MLSALHVCFTKIIEHKRLRFKFGDTNSTCTCTRCKEKRLTQNGSLHQRRTAHPWRPLCVRCRPRQWTPAHRCGWRPWPACSHGWTERESAAAGPLPGPPGALALCIAVATAASPVITRIDQGCIAVARTTIDTGSTCTSTAQRTDSSQPPTCMYTVQMYVESNFTHMHQFSLNP